MSSASILVVDCGSRHVAAARFSAAGKDRLRLQRFASVPVNADGRDARAWLAGVKAALQTLRRQGEWSGACLLGVPGHLTLVQGLEIPRTRRGARKKLLRFEAGQLVPGGLKGMVWAAQPTGGDGKREQVAITAIRAADVASLVYCAAQAGLHPVAACPGWVGVGTGSGDRGGEESRLVVTIGARTTTLLVRVGGRDLIRNLNLGGDRLTDDMAEELGIGWPRAEVLKLTDWTVAKERETQTPERTATQLAVDRLARRLAGEIGRLLAAAGGAETARPSILEIGGGGALAPGLAETLAERLDLPLRRLPADLTTEGSADGIPATPLEHSHLVEAAGLARHARAGGACSANLLPMVFRCSLWLTRHRKAVATGLAVLAAGLAASGWYWQREAGKRAGALAALETRVETTRREVDRDRAMLSRLARIEEQTVALRRLEAKRMAWVSFLADLEQRLAQVGDVWLERLAPPPASQRKARPRTAVARSGPRQEEVARPRPQGRSLRVSGCMLDPEHPTTAAGEGCRKRIKALWASLGASPFIAELVDERLEAGSAGILKFEVTLVLAPNTVPYRQP